MKLTHYGHSCVLLDFGPSGGGTRILFDPGSYSSGFDDVRELDAVLITHAHPDHLDTDRLSPVMASNPTARLIVDPGSATALDQAGITYELATPGQALTVGSIGVEVLGSAHAVIHPRLPNIGNNGYLLDGRVLHPGDAFAIPTTPVAVLLLPAGGPWMKLGESIDYMSTLQPRLVIPIHQAGLATVHQQLHYQLIRALAPQGTDVVVLDAGIAHEE